MKMPMIIALVLSMLLVISALTGEDSTASNASQPASSPTSAPAYSTWPFDAKEAQRRQEETAKALATAKELSIDLGNKVTMNLVLIPAGRFIMGAAKGPASRANNAQHEVTISRPFYMGATHVTRGQFAAFVDSASYKSDAERVGSALAWGAAKPVAGTKIGMVRGASWRKPGFEQTNDHPVVCVTRRDALAFCTWLSKKTGKKVGLPTEAQWEYACRAGTQTAWPWGDRPDGGKGWCNAADLPSKEALGERWTYFKWGDGYTHTAPGGQFKPNAFGLHDMLGNVWQWCADWYAKDYYANSPKVDPTGPDSGKQHVVRGGSYVSGPSKCGSAVRSMHAPVRVADFGFRVVLQVPKPEDTAASKERQPKGTGK